MTFQLTVKFDSLFKEKKIIFFNLKKEGGRYPAAVSGRNFRKLIIMSVSGKFARGNFKNSLHDVSNRKIINK